IIGWAERWLTQAPVCWRRCDHLSTGSDQLASGFEGFVAATTNFSSRWSRAPEPAQGKGLFLLGLLLLRRHGHAGNYHSPSFAGNIHDPAFLLLAGLLFLYL